MLYSIDYFFLQMDLNMQYDITDSAKKKTKSFEWNNIKEKSEKSEN